MKVTIPKDKRIESFLEFMFYKRVGESKDGVTYEGAFPFALSFRDLSIPMGTREKFCVQIKVENGFKVRYPDRIDITPFRKKSIHFRISEEELGLFEEYLKAHETTPSGHLRLRITEDVMDWMRLRQETEKTRRLREKHFAELKHEEHRHEESKMFG